MGAHLNNNGEFQSDKYPTCPPGKVPLSTSDPLSRDLLWELSKRMESVDSEFSEDLKAAILQGGKARPWPIASLNNLNWYTAKVIKVIDGDTVKLAIDVGFGWSKNNENYRLARINAPEMRGSQRPMGIKSRLGLVSMLSLGNQCIVNTIKNRKGTDIKGKYGRYIVDLYDMKMRCLNDWMVELGYAEYKEY